MSNLEIYNKVRAVPTEAKKPIIGGRLKGKTDINPMWRIKVLTEQFGICGIGWRAEITRQWLEEGANGEKSAFVNISLYIKVDGVWSEPIHGTGGSSFVAKEREGYYNNDECFKMAYTDAISVACKMLGVGADVYWDQDKTKYDKLETEPDDKKPDNAKAAEVFAKFQKLKAQGTDNWQGALTYFKGTTYENEVKALYQKTLAL